MVELWFYSGRIGNCMFAYALNRCVAHTLNLQCELPKGTEITGFPLVAEESKDVIDHDKKYIINKNFRSNPRTIVNENDNMVWFIEKQFQSGRINSYSECVTIDKILSTPNIENKWIVTLGNFETGLQYVPYRYLLQSWFRFPKFDYSKFDFFRIHKSLGLESFYESIECPVFNNDDLLISLRLEDYVNENNKDRLLTYDYFRIILESRSWNNVYILTNPDSIGHNIYYEYIKEFKDYNPIVVRCYDPVMSMGFGSIFNNIAISQSTYSWWLSFLSNAENIYYPIPKEGPFSFGDERYKGTDLRVPTKDFKYVDYEKRIILPYDYCYKIDYENKKWKD